MYTTANRETITPVRFPAGLDVHWETETRVIWNERELATDKEELIYAVSWIREPRRLAPLSKVAAEGSKLKASAEHRYVNWARHIQNSIC